jgi:hypothetical protein
VLDEPGPEGGDGQAIAGIVGIAGLQSRCIGA